MHEETATNNLHNFFSKEYDERINIIENAILKDNVHKFSTYKDFTTKDIAISTLEAMDLYVFNNELNPLGIVGDSIIKICFQPSANNKNDLHKVIIYFAHIITQDNNGVRIFSASKAKSIIHWNLILNSPDKLYSQNTTNKISLAFEKKIPSNKNRESAFIILYLEEIERSMFRVVTVLPDQNNKQVQRKKEKNSLVELSSFLELHDIVSQSVKDRTGSKCEPNPNSDTKLQNNPELQNNIKNISESNKINSEQKKYGGVIENTDKQMYEEIFAKKDYLFDKKTFFKHKDCNMYTVDGKHWICKVNIIDNDYVTFRSNHADEYEAKKDIFEQFMEWAAKKIS